MIINRQVNQDIKKEPGKVPFFMKNCVACNLKIIQVASGDDQDDRL